jgi:hypothetical protein
MSVVPNIEAKGRYPTGRSQLSCGLIRRSLFRSAIEECLVRSCRFRLSILEKPCLAYLHPSIPQRYSIAPPGPAIRLCFLVAKCLVTSLREDAEKLQSGSGHLYGRVALSRWRLRKVESMGSAMCLASNDEAIKAASTTYLSALCVSKMLKQCSQRWKTVCVSSLDERVLSRTDPEYVVSR